MARVGTYLFATGAAVGLVSLAFGAVPGRDDRAILVLALAALGCALLELGVYDRLPVIAFQLLSACGTALISGAVYFGGGSGHLYTFLYVWVVLYAAYFYTWRRAAFQVLLIAVVYAAVLPTAPAASFAALDWFLTVSTLAVAGALVVLLRGRLDRLLAAERRRVEQLRELDRLKDDVLATVSHELRTPLAAVYGAAITLRRQKLDEDTREAMLLLIDRESERLGRLVDQILWASRPDFRHPRATPEPCDAAALTRAVVDSAGAHLPERVSLALATPPALPAISADPEKLRQVLSNLIDNAVKYSPDGGSIEVRVGASDEGFVVFTIRDEGLGIPLSERRRIFEKFHRLDPNLTRGVGGTGLGLYISRALVEQMGGRIWVVSGQGRGSTFAFELPVFPLEAEDGEAPSAPPPPATRVAGEP